MAVLNLQIENFLLCTLQIKKILPNCHGTYTNKETNKILCHFLTTTNTSYTKIKNYILLSKYYSIISRALLTRKCAVRTIYNKNKRHLFHARLYFIKACTCMVWKYSKTSIKIKKVGKKTHDSILTVSQFWVITSRYIIQAIQSLFLHFSETNSKTPNWTTSSSAPHSASHNKVPYGLYSSHGTWPYSQCEISCRQMKICCLQFWFLWLTTTGYELVSALKW